MRFYVVFIACLFAGIAANAQKQTINVDTVKIDSTNVKKYNELARYFQKQYQYRQAKILFEKIYLSDTTNVEYINQFAAICMQLNNNKQALRLLKNTLKVDSLNIYALISLGDIYQRSGKGEEAIAAYLYVINIVDSTNYYALKQAGIYYAAQGNGFYNLAVDYFKAAHRVNPGDLSINYKLGDIYNKMYKFDLTHNLCTEGLSIDPGNIPLIQLKGYTHFLQDQYKLAEQTFSNFLANGDTTAFSIKYLGQSQYFNLKPTEAKHSLERALAYDSTDFDTYILLGDINLQMGLTEKAQWLFEKAVTLTFPAPTKHAEVYLGLSNVCNVRRDWDKAIEYLELACKANPRDMKLVFRLAAYYDYKKDFVTAARLYNKVIDQGDPKLIGTQITASKTRVDQLKKTKQNKK